MFGLSLSEIFVIALVALIVIGPERLPKTARALGLLVGRAQRYVNDIKSDIEREMHVEDIKKFKDEVTSNVTQVKSSVEEEISSVTDPLKKIKNPLDAVKSEVADIEKQLKGDLNPLPDLKDLNIDEPAKKAVSSALSEAPKAAAVKSTAAAVAGVSPEVSADAEVKEALQAFSVNPSASFEPITSKGLVRSTVAESLIYPDEKDEGLASAADVIEQRWSPSADEVVAAEPTQQFAGIYDGPTFEPLEAPELSPEELEARDEAWAVLVEDDDSPVDTDKSLEGLAMWEQMPQGQATEDLMVKESEGQTIAIAKTQDKNNSNSDDGDLNV